MIAQGKRIVDFEHPWLGLESFTEQTKQFFYGRNQEIRDLFLRVRENPLTILCGQSGLGKSSLLGAGLIPKLRIEGYRPYLLRLDFEQNENSLVQQTLEAFDATLAGAGEQVGAVATHWMDPGKTLWENLHREPNPIPQLRQSPPVLIFDQFEEIFTLARTGQRQTEAEELLRQLADFVENRPPFELQERFRADPALKRGYDWNASPVRIVIALRDDYLSYLQAWKNVMPSVMRNQMALHLLTGPQALEAVVQPGRLGERELVDEEVGARIVRFVAKRPPTTPLAEIEAVPPLVSLMCDELNNARLAAAESTITARRVDEQSADILQSFYHQSFDGLHPGVRKFVEDRLITVGGHRIPVAREDAESEMSAAGAPDPAEAIARLVQRRLLIPDERGGVQQLWITHDVLAPLVLRSRDERRERQRVEEAEQQAWELRQGRRRALMLAAVFGILLLISLLAGFYGWTQARQARNQAAAAQRAETQAERERDAATKARDQSAIQRERAEEREREATEAKQLEEEAHRQAEEQKRAAELAAERLEATLARSDYFLAVARWKEGRAREAQQFLRRVPEKYRNFEWRYDNRLFQGGYMTLYGHQSFVSSVAFSPDGTRIASGSADSTIKLWNAVTGEELRTLTGHTSGVTSVAFSPDGTRIASGSRDNTIKLSDAASGEELHTLTGHSSDVNSVAFSSDGMRIASGSNDKTIKLWDAPTGEGLSTLRGHTQEVYSVAFSPDGTLIASGSRDNTIKLWDAATGEELRTLAGHTSNVNSVVFSPDGTRIASGSWDDTIKLWDAATGEELRSLTGHSDWVLRVAFSPDGTRIASGSDDMTIKLWDAATGEELRTLTGHSWTVSSAAFSPDGSRIASGSNDMTIKLWDAANSEELHTLTGHSWTVSSVAFSPDGTRIASGGGDYMIKLWDAATGEELRTLTGHTEMVSSVAFSPDGMRIASVSEDRTIKLWDAATGEELCTLTGHTGLVLSVGFSPLGTRIYSISRNGEKFVWDVQTGERLQSEPWQDLGPEKVVSPDGRWGPVRNIVSLG